MSLLNALYGRKQAKTRWGTRFWRVLTAAAIRLSSVVDASIEVTARQSRGRHGPLPAKIPPGCGNSPCAAHSFA
jgi:hypothetical protein